MRKLSKLFLMGVVALGLGLTACNSDDIDTPQDDQKGNTHVSIALKLSKGSSGPSSLRALPNDYNVVGEWAGKDKFSTVTVYLVDGTSVTSQTFTVGTDYIQGTDATTGDITLTPSASAAIRTTAGSKTVYVVVNETAPVHDWLNKTSVAEFENAYKTLPLALANSGTSATVSTSASKLATINGITDESIVMTNVAPATITVEPYVTKDETVTTTSPKNRASLQVERAVARVMVTIKEAATYSIPDPNSNGATSLGTLTDITWVVAQGENSLYVQRKIDWNTPNYTWVPGVSGNDFITQAGDKYDYSGLFENKDNKFGGTNVPTYADYATNYNNGSNPVELNTRWLDGKFILPNTHVYAPAPAAGSEYTGGYRKGNTAYVLIRAKFTPASGAYADQGTPNPDGTFYVGSDGKFYKSAQNAYEAGNTEMSKYVEGKVLYYAWLNPDQKPDWYNSPVLRNNIYHIHITGFKTLGTNWNPLYPEDPDAQGYDPENPNNPDPRPVPDEVETPGGGTFTPETPDSPIKPEDPLTLPETWMSVDVTVLPWLVHSYSVDLGL
jgi:hypothetical protein